MGRWLYYTKKLARRWESDTSRWREPITIALDAMGGDHGPAANLEGALDAVTELRNLRIKLVGRSEELKKALGKAFLPEEIEIVHAEEAFSMDAPPVEALRSPNSSIMRSISLLERQEAQGFVSMGNTGAIVASSLVKLGRIDGIERPALMTLFPASEGRPTLVLDIGATVDCRPRHLLWFARMGSVYAESVLDRPNPTVSLLSIGEEPSKGNSLIKETHQLLKSSDLNFIGNIEGGDVLNGKSDVVVTDGFIGNTLLKFGEGSMGFLKHVAKKGRRSNLFSFLWRIIAKSEFKKIMREFDYSEYGGAPLLGIKGNVIVGHGRSSPKAIANAISLAYIMANSNIDKKLAAYAKSRQKIDQSQNIRNRIKSS